MRCGLELMQIITYLEGIGWTNSGVKDIIV